MNKSILIIVCAIISLSCKTSHLETTVVEKPKVIYNSDSTTVKLTGIVTNVKNKCWVDGVCSIEVDDTWWIGIEHGKRARNFWLKERGRTTGIRFSKENESIGKKVTVYAKIKGNKDQNKLTLEGSKTYYVKTIE